MVNEANTISESANGKEAKVMKRWLLTMLAALGLLAATGRVVQAMTADGTLITNVACATYMSASGQGFAVSYCVTARIQIANPCLALQKIANPTTQASGGTVTYTVWVVNCSCDNSAFNINVTDRLPDMVAMDAARGTWNGESGGNWTAASGSNNTTWAANVPLAGQVAPYFLRYVLDQLGPCKSAFVAFSVSVQ
jgi:uncharacterized repeat protein (TIGR01451 family)